MKKRRKTGHIRKVVSLNVPRFTSFFHKKSILLFNYSVKKNIQKRLTEDYIF